MIEIKKPILELKEIIIKEIEICNKYIKEYQHSETYKYYLSKKNKLLKILNKLIKIMEEYAALINATKEFKIFKENLSLFIPIFAEKELFQKYKNKIHYIIKEYEIIPKEEEKELLELEKEIINLSFWNNKK